MNLNQSLIKEYNKYFFNAFMGVAFWLCIFGFFIPFTFHKDLLFYIGYPFQILSIIMMGYNCIKMFIILIKNFKEVKK